ncbi:hypothetical protein ACP4OV_026397 [Aristida adscensionis]
MEELGLLACVTIAAGGILPKINPVLLPKRAAEKPDKEAKSPMKKAKKSNYKVGWGVICKYAEVGPISAGCWGFLSLLGFVGDVESERRAHAPCCCGALREAVESDHHVFLFWQLQTVCLSYDTNETALKDAFSQFGDVIEAKVICHPVTGKSKGYGFVKFSSEDEAVEALKQMNGQVLDEKNIRVHYANSG